MFWWTELRLERPYRSDARTVIAQGPGCAGRQWVGQRDGRRWLRNLAIGIHRQDGRTNIAAALRHAARDYHRPLAALGLTG
ncbi:hypothetical protein [Streptomyces sp. NPDC101455]|uniref:hypothetical protein n=1 Tax=Streptomyces sp. NPDC101455 TaxID=3366142 RepID=UPI003817AD94